MSISSRQTSSTDQQRRSSRASNVQEIDLLDTPLGKEKKEKVVNVFRLYDHGNRQRVNITDIPQIVRALGLYVTEAEAKGIAKEVEDKNFAGTVQLNKFTNYMADIMLKEKYRPESTDTLLDAFEIFDTEKNGYLDRQYFEDIMTLSTNDDEKISLIERKLTEEKEKLLPKVSLSDEGIEKNKAVFPTKSEEKLEDDDFIKIEPLSQEEFCEMMKVALDPKTNTINYRDLILKFLACQNFKESSI